MQKLLLVFIAALSILNPVLPVDAEDPPLKYGPWNYLWGGKVKSLAKSELQLLENFEIRGAHPNDLNKLNTAVVDGEWGLNNGALQQQSGRCVALQAGAADNFILEAGMNAEGKGGWFIVVGYDEGHGYGVYNVSLKTSGSSWHFLEFRGGQGIESTEEEFVRYDCRGNETLVLKVENKKMSLQINRRVLLDQQEMPNYEAGKIILGTYDTQYGPKPLKLYGIRMKTAE